jgi:hypothetical protein
VPEIIKRRSVTKRLPSSRLSCRISVTDALGQHTIDNFGD